MSAISDSTSSRCSTKVQLDLGLGEQFLDPAGRAAPRRRRAASRPRRRRPCVRGRAAGSAPSPPRRRPGERPRRPPPPRRSPARPGCSSACMIVGDQIAARERVGVDRVARRNRPAPRRRRSWPVRRGSSSARRSGRISAPSRARQLLARARQPVLDRQVVASDAAPARPSSPARCVAGVARSRSAPRDGRTAPAMRASSRALAAVRASSRIEGLPSDDRDRQSRRSCALAVLRPDRRVMARSVPQFARRPGCAARRAAGAGRHWSPRRPISAS